MLLASGAANAATQCTFVSGGGMSFGAYDVLSAAPNDSLATVQVLCRRDGGPQHVTITLQLSAGANGSSVNARRMINSTPGGGYLTYGLFRDVGRSAVWGFSNGVDAGSIALSIPNRSAVAGTFTIYGRIPALQDVAVGSYGDSVVMTVNP
jgi:spore coat protein U-like protein